MIDQFLHFFGAEPRDAEHFPDALGEGFFQLLVQRKGALPNQLGNLLGEGGPDPLDPGQFAAGDQFGNGPILGLDDPGPLGIGPDFERVLPGQFQQLGDFSQDPGDFLVFHIPCRAG